jgi:transitional endoplasmic reticulum ATPase
VAPPDYDARKALFEMYLKEIPKDFGIDYEKLATITANYVSSDIKLIVDEVARGLRKSRGRVTMEILENKIHLSKPSVKMDVLQKHEKIRKKFESGNEEDQSNERVKIGFKSSKSK